MPNTVRLSRGLLLIFVGLFFATTLPIIWVYYNRPEDRLYEVFEALSFIMMWIGAFTILSFDSKRWAETYAEEKLLADFLRELVFPTILQEPRMRTFIIDRLVSDMVFQPERWQPVAVKLAPGTRQIIVEFCRQRIQELSRQATLEAQNGEVDGSANREMRLRDEIFQLETLVRSIASQ